jgi:hypothetical protein
LIGVFSMPRILHSNSLLHISPEGISVDAREASGKLAGGKVLIAVIRPSGIEEYALVPLERRRDNGTQTATRKEQIVAMTERAVADHPLAPLTLEEVREVPRRASGAVPREPEVH